MDKEEIIRMAKQEERDALIEEIKGLLIADGTVEARYFDLACKAIMGTIINRGKNDARRNH